jgi:hypothetical protein
MNSTNLIIIVFGLIILTWLINQQKEGFSFFDKIEQFIDTLNQDEETTLQKDWDLGKEMQKVMAQKQDEIKNAENQFKIDTLNGIEPRNFYTPTNRTTGALEYPMTNNGEEFFPLNTARFSEDISKLDWKLEKNPHQVIEEMKNTREEAPDRMLKPISIKEAFDNAIKNYKRINPKINDNLEEKKPNSNPKALDQKHFSYLEGKQPQIPNQDEIFALDPIATNFTYF